MRVMRAEKKKEAETVKSPRVSNSAKKIEAGLREAIDWSQCPRCAERMKKQVEANKRYRMKKREG